MLEVLYHQAKFGGFHPTPEQPKTLIILSVGLFVTLTLPVYAVYVRRTNYIQVGGTHLPLPPWFSTRLPIQTTAASL